MKLDTLIRQTKPAYDGRSRHLARKKALEIISFIAVHKDDEDKDWTLAYTLAHVALGKCGNAHEDWQAELDEKWEELHEAGEV